jgi:DNA-binding NtrC family response regulator
MTFRVLIVEDEPVVQDVLKRLFKPKPWQITIESRGDGALARFQQGEVYDVILTDLMLPGASGIEILKSARMVEDMGPVIVMTAYASVDNAVEAMKLGAAEYIPKPFNNDQVLLTVEKALQGNALLKENQMLKRALEKKYRFDNIIGHSDRMQEVFELIRLAAPSTATILIRGESGTGKELVAKAIHFNSQRKAGPFVTVNAGAIPETLLESQLFGHERGAFTGAVQRKNGMFEEAHHGTFFLDEIGNLNLELQSKLLRVIQEKEVLRIGANLPNRVDVRLICATNADLEHLVQLGEFREDLYYRLNVIEILMPPLRDRREDIPILVDYFVRKYRALNGKPDLGIDSEFVQTLEGYHFPGNVRELENLVERAVVLCQGPQLVRENLPAKLLERRSRKLVDWKPGEGFHEKIQHFERELLQEALQAAGGLQKKAAESLGLKASTFSEMLKRHQLRK